MTEKKGRAVPKKQVSQYALEIIHYIGGILIFFGLSYLVAANWDVFNSPVKIACTFGAAILAWIIALALYKHKSHISPICFLLSALLLPIGIFVILQIREVTWLPDTILTFITAIGLILFGCTYLRLKQTSLLIIAFIYGSILFLSLFNYVISFTHFASVDLSPYAFILLGLSYIYLGYRLRKNHYHFLTSPLYFVGCLFTLGSTYFLGTHATVLNTPQFIFWKIMIGLFIFLAFIAAIQLKHKIFLYLAFLFLILYLITLSSYFHQLLGNQGWPLLLILVGIFCVLINYLMYLFKSKPSSLSSSKRKK